MTLTKAFKLEIFKLRHKYFLLTWLILTLAPLLYLIYNLRIITFSPHVHFETLELVYLYEQTAVVWLLALFLPIMASLLISKLTDLDHKNENWRLLLTANENIKTLWWVKFLIVFLLMETSTFIFFVVMSFRIYQILSVPVPVVKLFWSFIGLTGANFITLTIAQCLAFYYKNQAVVLIEGLLASFIALISSLLPKTFRYFLPWSYYSLNVLAVNESLGYGNDGIVNWKIVEVYPNYTIIFAVSILFIILNVVAMKKLTKKEI